METPISFSPLKIQIKFWSLFLLMWAFWLSFLRYLDSSPWYINLIILALVVGTPYVGIKTYLMRRESHQLLSIILPELEEGTLLSSDVDYIDESLKIIVYDHYLIGYAGGDCVDIYEIELMRVPVLGRSKSKTTVQVKSKSRGHFEIYTPAFLTTDPISGLHRLANYLNENFDIEIEAYD